MNSRPRISSILACFILSLMILFGGNSIVFSADAIWNGGTGFWNITGNWSGGLVPNGTYNVYIDGGKTGVTSIVTLDVDASITGLTIDANSAAPNDKLIIGNGRVLTLTGAANVTNNGTIEMAASNADTYLVLGASSVVFSGTGEFVLGVGDNGIRSRISSNNPGYRLTNDTGHTIRGAGYIGLANLLLTNNGTITADNPSYALYVQPSGTSINTGTMQAINGASLQLLTQNFTNTGGTIKATGADSNVLLVNGATITGGNITTDSVGIVGTFNSGTLDGVTITSGSSFKGLNGSGTYLQHTITNQGTMTIAGANADTRFYLDSTSVTLTGGGTLVLDPGDNGSRSRISSTNNAYTLVNDTANTIRGAGYVGENNLVLNNKGTITADNSTYSLIINPSNTSTNTGTMQATGGATLQLWNRAYTNTEGTILANGTNSQVLLVGGATITGGNLTTASGGLIATTGGQTGTLDNVTIASGSSFKGLNGSGTYLQHTITNQGTMTIASTNANTFFALNSTSVTLTGGGTLALDAGDNGIRSRISSNNANYALVNDTANTISGAGYVGEGNLILNNKGTITADNSTYSLIINPSNTSTNTGTMQATGGATLQLWNKAYTNAGGTMLATGAGSTVLLVGATITGGNITTTSGGVIATANTGTLDGVTITSGSSFKGLNGSGTYLQHTITNQGTMTIAGANADTRFYLDSTSVTLAGGGTLVLDPGDNGIRPRISSTNNAYVLINDTANTIRGAGYVGEANLVLNNKGTITADNSAYPLYINPSNTSTNTGTMQATGGGTLRILNVAYNNSGGLIQAVGPGSHVDLASNARINNGTLTTSGGGVIYTLGGQVATLDGITLTSGSSFTGQNSSATYLKNSINNQGTMTIAGTNADTYFFVDDTTLTLTGSGSVVLEPGDNGQRSRISSNNSGYVLVNDTGHTISGAGYVSLGNLHLTNEGTITADRTAGPLRIYPSATSTNTGTMQAISGAALELYSQTFNNAGGLIQAVGTGSHVDLLNGVTILGGTLTTTGGGVINTVGGQVATLDGITLTSGSSFTGQNSSATYLKNSINNQGTMTIAGANADTPFILNDTAVTLTGNGTLVLNPGDNGARSRITSNNANYVLTNDTGHTIRGAGYVGINDLGLINKGTIIADNSTYPLQIYPSGSKLNNQGTLRATNGATLIVGNTNFTNLSGTTLTGGTYEVFASSTMKLPAATGIATNAATILLDGVNSSIVRTADSLDALTPYFATNAAAGHFTIQNGRNFGTAGNFSNAGIVTIGNSSTFTVNGIPTNSGELQLRGGTFAATTGLSNSGNVNGFGTIQPSIANTGSVIADGGTLTANQILGTTGTVQANPGAMLQTGNFSTAGTLVNNGNLSVSGLNFTVYSDYQNANFGTGNSFNPRANVSGGAINGNLASQTITGDVTSVGANTWTLDLGNVRGGTSTTLNYQIANNGTGATKIRGAVQTAVNGGNITDARLSGMGVTPENFGPIAVGNDAGSFGVTFNATSGGSLTGQSIAIVSNFSNIAPQIINLNGTATALAVGNATPNTNPVVLGNFHVGAASVRDFDVANTTSGAYAERLGISSWSTTGNFVAVNNLGTGFITGGGSMAGAVTAQVNNGTAGVNSGSMTIQYTTNGELIDPSFTTINTNSQTINLQATGYNLAAGNATPAPVVLANQRVGGTLIQPLTVTNTAPVGSFTEGLNVTFGTNSGNALNNGGTINLLAGQANNSSAMNVSVDTGSAGAKSGTVTLNYVSDGTGTSELGVTPLAPQTVNVSGNVYRLAAGSAGDVNLGNFHVGANASGAIIVSNTAANDGFSEKLNATVSSFDPAVTATSGSVNLLAAGANSNAISATIGNVLAGINTGSVTLAYQSDGAGTSGLSPISAGSQNVSVQATGYRLAEANTISAVNFGNVHVGDLVSQALTISNQATNDIYSEKLNASFGGVSDARITTNGGSIDLLGAGATDNTSMLIGLNTGAAGTVTGTVTVHLQSDGTGTSGLGITNLSDQNVGVSGIITTANVYRLAQPSAHTPEPVNFGNVRIGTTQAQALTIGNIAPDDGWSEKLNASIATNNPGIITTTGSFNLLSPQAYDSSSLVVGINTSTAGVKSGTATITLASDGTGTSELGVTPLAPQTVNVSGNVYRLANPTLNTSSVTIAARVGDAVSADKIVSITNTSPDIYTEGLKVNVTGASGNAQSNGGSITNLVAQGTNNSAIQVGLNSTATAGLTSGTVNLNFISTGAGTTGASDIAAQTPGGTVIINGKVYTPAVASLSGTIDFGIVHVGDSVSTQQLTVQNAAPVTDLNDVLQGTLTTSGPFTGGGTLSSDLGAGASQAFNIGLDTSAAGVFSAGTATFAGVSHNADMADLGLGNPMVELAAQINNYANPVFDKTSGDGLFGGGGLSFTLNFGTVLQNSGTETAYLQILNDVLGPSDFLSGSFSSDSPDWVDFDFIYAGFNEFKDLGAGQSFGGLMLALNTTELGTFSETITLSALGYNASGYKHTFDIALIVQGNVVEATATPEPTTMLLLGFGLIGLVVIRRKIQT